MRSKYASSYKHMHACTAQPTEQNLLASSLFFSIMESALIYCKQIKQKLISIKEQVKHHATVTLGIRTLFLNMLHQLIMKYK